MTDRGKIGWRLGILTAAILFLALLAGCVLFNQSPVARIAASILFGNSPLVVTFDASDSADPDGRIVGFLWDFGDGDTDTGETVTHTFLATMEATTFTVTLTVIDDRNARTETSQTIEVFPPDGEAPTGEGIPIARFTANKLVGLIPLTVRFDAGGSTGGAGSIIEYSWDFGDGATATGTPVTHTFEPERTDEFMVTLFVWNSEGQVDAEQVEIIAIVPGDQTGDEEPVAEFVVSDPLMILESESRPVIPSLFEVSFDPRGSYPDVGHRIEYFVWDFGDGEFHIEESDLEVTHIYELHTLTRVFVVQLTVYDDQGLEGTMLVNVTLTDPFGEGDIDEEE